MLSENNGSIRPPPYRRNVPRYHSHAPRKKNCCLRCICCCYCLLLVLVLILAGLLFYFYTFYSPQIPSYKVDNLSVTAFDIQPDFSVNTELLVSVKANNPNEGIGFIYGRDSSVVVAYNGTALCSGKLPSFQQGERNMTIMQVTLKGKSEFGSGLQEALTENKHNGRIPLLVKVKAPVSIVVGQFPMRQFVVFVNCSLIVDNLAANTTIQILSSKYNVDFSLT